MAAPRVQHSPHAISDPIQGEAQRQQAAAEAAAQAWARANLAHEEEAEALQQHLTRSCNTEHSLRQQITALEVRLPNALSLTAALHTARVPTGQWRFWSARGTEAPEVGNCTCLAAAAACVFDSILQLRPVAAAFG